MKHGFSIVRGLSVVVCGQLGFLVWLGFRGGLVGFCCVVVF